MSQGENAVAIGTVGIELWRGVRGVAASTGFGVVGGLSEDGIDYVASSDSVKG